MKTNLLIVEKIVLESLYCEEKKFEELVEDTGLSQIIIANILQDFILQGVIGHKESKYYITGKGLECYLNNSMDIKELKSEAKELFVSILNSHFQDKDKTKSDAQEKSTVKVAKIWVSEQEEKILNAMFKNIELFLRQATKKGQGEVSLENRRPLKVKKVICWGYSSYQDVLDTMIKCV